jgi:EAL domain-containing protein (putative c-di-GMP-specific phosphodiesterase class I)
VPRKGLTFPLAVDDFGIGYSSLAYLKRFPIDVLKIDKAFVDGLGGGDARSGAIAGVVVQLAHALGLTPVAEGVETQEQVVDLRALDCTCAQGFYFARPQAPEAMTDLLAYGGPLPVEP